MEKSIKIGTMPRIVEIDGRVKIKEGKIIKVKESYKIKITKMIEGVKIQAEII